jgi:hypothetical protein
MGKGSPYGAKDTDQKKISFEQLVLRIPGGCQSLPVDPVT